jgi:phospholipase D1/2
MEGITENGSREIPPPSHGASKAKTDGLPNQFSLAATQNGDPTSHGLNSNIEAQESSLPTVPITRTGGAPAGSPAAREDAADYMAAKSRQTNHGQSFPFAPSMHSVLDHSNRRRASEGHNAYGSTSVDDTPTPALSHPSGTSTPPGRRSVQFARSALPSDLHEFSSSRQGSVSKEGEERPETPNRDKKANSSLFVKLRSLVPSAGLQTYGRTQSGFTIGGSSTGGDEVPSSHSPGTERDESRYYDTLQEESVDGDADAEGSGHEDDPRQEPRKRRKSSRRPIDEGVQTAPTTPKTPINRGGRLNQIPFSNATPLSARPPPPRRRATMTDMSDQERADQRGGMSEGEGRDRMGKPSAWRRGSHWVNNAARGQSYSAARPGGIEHGTPDGRRPLTLRRLTGFGPHESAGDGPPSATRRAKPDRGSSVSAARWRSLKAGLKMMGQRKKEENKIDTLKSAELLAELTAGTPAAVILASMFQRDEHGNKRIPVLLEQLKLQITDSQKVDSKSSSERHLLFRIELEYGSGLTRMKWVIHRTIRDFANLHLRYKLQLSSEKYKQLSSRDDPRQKLPHFPKSAFPYLRGVRGLGSEDEDEDEEDDYDTALSGAEGAANGPDRPSKKRRRRSSFAIVRRKSSIAAGDASSLAEGMDHHGAIHARREPYPARQRKKLEMYTQKMLRHLAFRADSNRLCKFLELSALGVRLAAEGSYHGKEGFLIIQSAKGLDFRRGWQPSQVKSRHSPKWFLVRHSYIVCVDSPEQMNIYDVFLVDEDFVVQPPKKRKRDAVREKSPKAIATSAKVSATHPKHHSLKICNSERRLKLLAKNERQLHQFEDSVRFMLTQTPWSRKNRFDSFAPVRQGVFAQWLVDGRDHMWNVSRAISMARDVVYIHDWWLSPELYMRRPAAISQKWRLDRLLQRKAQEGVKIFVIMYRNINSAIPIDSQYSKFSLLDLHPNVFVQRSPNQARQGAFFWAHHEKICIVDHTVAFVGGVDLCFGRWDTPQHSLSDDKLTGYEDSAAPKDSDHLQLWPGKDYSNPRVQDFYALDKPYEEMYDRTKVPRMPWHDISMQVVGQPARDLTRHFVQRWNFVLRQRRPTRPTPFLLPPADFNSADLESLGLDGTCEVQILRSCSWWSIGTPGKTEHSIMNAYIKMIEQSEHFVYIENQFFISSCEVEGTKIENLIGDALVERATRAAKNGEDWRAVIVIPLMPGFQNTVDEQDGTSVRLIMQCQYRSICRGESSIFGRLRAQDIEPEDYVQFYSLRSWGRIGPLKTIVTEQLYIHAKVMIVDDRIAIIGSANINERSMLGVRDSECAAVVRDTDMIWSTMNGEPYLVGRFPHTLRMRLMQEHLGLDVDEIMEEDRRNTSQRSSREWERDMDRFHGEDDASTNSAQVNKETETKIIDSRHQIQDDVIRRSERMSSFNHDVDWEQKDNPNLKSDKALTTDKRVIGNEAHHKDVAGLGFDHMADAEKSGLDTSRDTVLDSEGQEVLINDIASEGKGTLLSPKKSSTHQDHRSPHRDADEEGNAALLPPSLTRKNSKDLGLTQLSQLPPLPVEDDSDIGSPSLQKFFSKRSVEMLGPLFEEINRPFIDKHSMQDPLTDSFYLDTWHAVAENNTKLYRNVFRCMPDNEVQTWKEYKEYSAYSERFAQAQGGAKSKSRMAQENPNSKSGPPGQSAVAEKLAMMGTIGERFGEAERKVEILGGKIIDKVPSNNLQMGRIEDWADDASKAQSHREGQHQQDEKQETPQEKLDHDSKSRNGDGPPASNEKQQQQQQQAPLSRVSEDTISEFPAYVAAANTSGPADITSPEGHESEKGHKQSLPNPLEPTPSANSQKRRRRATTHSSRREFHASDGIMDMKDAETALGLVQGHLIIWPYDWLAKEEQGGNWLYSIDQLAPLEI